MATTKNVFISFDYEHDEDAKILLDEQTRLPDSPFEITDASERAPLTGDWGDKVLRRMDDIDMVIVMRRARISSKRHGCGIDDCSGENTPYFLLTAYPHRTCTGQHQQCHQARSTGEEKGVRDALGSGMTIDL